MTIVEKGIKILAQTKTVEDMFGDVIWEVDSVDNEIVKLIMLGGTGPSARKGYAVQDTLTNIEKGIKNKTIKLLSSEKANAFVERYNSNGPSSPGGMEISY